MYKDNDEVLIIRWTIEDIKMALKNKGIKPTQKNIEKLLDNRCSKTLDEGSIAHGWDILDDIITNTFN